MQDKIDAAAAAEGLSELRLGPFEEKAIEMALHLAADIANGRLSGCIIYGFGDTEDAFYGITTSHPGIKPRLLAKVKEILTYLESNDPFIGEVAGHG